MGYLGDDALANVLWAALTGPIAAAMPARPAHGRGLASEPAVASVPRHAHDGLAELLKAGLVEVGKKIVFDGRATTIGIGGVPHHGTHQFAVSTVNALATHLSGCTVNGWHLWRCARQLEARHPTPSLTVRASVVLGPLTGILLRRAVEILTDHPH